MNSRLVILLNAKNFWTNVLILVRVGWTMLSGKRTDIHDQSARWLYTHITSKFRCHTQQHFADALNDQQKPLLAWWSWLRSNRLHPRKLNSFKTGRERIPLLLFVTNNWTRETTSARIAQQTEEMKAQRRGMRQNMEELKPRKKKWVEKECRRGAVAQWLQPRRKVYRNNWMKFRSSKRKQRRKWRTVCNTSKTIRKHYSEF